MGRSITVESRYRHPRTHQLISKQKALTYLRRTGKRVKPERWMIVRHAYTERAMREAPQTRKLQGRIEYSARLHTVEKILPVSTFADRKIRQTLANKRVYQKIWENWGGEIRITISGHSKGRRVKEIIHAAFLKSVWVEHYDAFKDWLTGIILANLRKRGLRISNPKESKRRIDGLKKNRQGMTQMLDFVSDPTDRDKLLRRIKWATESIRKQKKSKQMLGATIRIEKLS